MHGRLLLRRRIDERDGFALWHGQVLHRGSGGAGELPSRRLRLITYQHGGDVRWTVYSRLLLRRWVHERNGCALRGGAILSRRFGSTDAMSSWLLRFVGNKCAGNVQRPMLGRLFLYRWVNERDGYALRRWKVLPGRVGDTVAVPSGFLWPDHDKRSGNVRWAMLGRLLLPRGFDVRGAVYVPGRPLLPFRHGLGDAVPLPRGYVLARRRDVHGARLVPILRRRLLLPPSF